MPRSVLVCRRTGGFGKGGLTLVPPCLARQGIFLHPGAHVGFGTGGWVLVFFIAARTPFQAASCRRGILESSTGDRRRCVGIYQAKITPPRK